MEKVGFAADAYLGYLTTSPVDLGTGLQIRGTLTEIKSGLFDAMEIAEKSGMSLDTTDCQRVVLQSSETLKANMNETGQLVEFFDCISELYRSA